MTAQATTFLASAAWAEYNFASVTPPTFLIPHVVK